MIDEGLNILAEISKEEEKNNFTFKLCSNYENTQFTSCLEPYLSV